jgi:hypothetical protein
MIKVLENFIPKNLQDHFEAILSSNRFPWYFQESVTNDFTLNKKNYKDSSFLAHVFHRNDNGGYSDSHLIEKFGVIRYFAEEKLNISIKEVVRLQTNLNLKRPDFKDSEHHGIHVDETPNAISKSLLYYVNDSDGDTYFYSKDGKLLKRISPKKGTALYFNSNFFHASSPPRKTNKRIVINFVFNI